MKICCRRKVRKHKEIKGSDNIVTLDISAKFDSLKKMETTSSESKEKLEISGKGLVTALAFFSNGKICLLFLVWTFGHERQRGSQPLI